MKRREGVGREEGGRKEGRKGIRKYWVAQQD